MDYVLTALIGVIAGAVCVFALLLAKRDNLKQREGIAESATRRAREAIASLASRESELNDRAAGISAARAELDQGLKDIQAKAAELDRRIISYRELQDENTILKRDLQNIDVSLHKNELDGEMRQQKQLELDQRSRELGKRYLDETVKAVVSSVGANNFAACKQRLLKVIGWCREIGFGVSAEEEGRLLASLRTEFERAVRAAFEREEQARINAQIREEEKLKREVDRELKQLERERAAIQAALDKALAEAQDKHSEQIQLLQAKLAEAEERSRRAVSQAQLTKAGNVYVISNIGSFGEGVFKVGMTRRLEPLDRVRELGDASVPFPFDVHMMIKCDDAPALENALHRELHKMKLNKTNPRKEFFKTDIEMISQIVKNHHGEVQYVADPEALEYRQSLTMSEEDSAFIDSVYDAAAGADDKVAEED